MTLNKQMQNNNNQQETPRMVTGSRNCTKEITPIKQIIDYTNTQPHRMVTRSMSYAKRSQQEFINFIKIELVQFENSKTNDGRALKCFNIFDYILKHVEVIQSFDSLKWYKFKNIVFIKYNTILQTLSIKKYNSVLQTGKSVLTINEKKLLSLLVKSRTKISIFRNLF
jgi:hypothetical protein